MQTIVPALLRKIDQVHYVRERINTPDGDFLDLDWSQSGNDHLVIICHGLEGDTSRAYIKGMVRQFSQKGWDVLAWNLRGCSEEINQRPRFYHSGATDDLHTVIEYALNHHSYPKISLLGFSLGGNMVLKYLGEQGAQVHVNIQKAMGISVPLDLHGSSLKISQGFNKIYGHRFLKQLKEKVRRKAKFHAAYFDLETLEKTNNLIDFDDLITAPLHGFNNAVDYYHKCSALHFIDSIKIPTLIVNAKNDPFLPPTCYPADRLIEHPFVELMVPAQGGHCGFADEGLSNVYWSEMLAWNYMNS